MSGVDGGGLSAEEREAHGRRADSFPAMQLVYSLTDVEILLRRHVAAAEQARDLERFKYEHEHKAAVIYADRAKAAEQRAERVTAELSSTQDALAFANESVEKMREQVKRGVGICWHGTCRQPAMAFVNGWPVCSEHGEVTADPTPREYDDGGPRVREAVERAERDAEVAARAWEEGAFAGREYQKRLLSEWSRIGPTPMHAPNPYRATATEGGDQP